MDTKRSTETRTRKALLRTWVADWMNLPSALAAVRAGGPADGPPLAGRDYLIDACERWALRVRESITSQNIAAGAMESVDPRTGMPREHFPAAMERAPRLVVSSLSVLGMKAFPWMPEALTQGHAAARRDHLAKHKAAPRP